MKVAFIGAGNMGAPMALNLIRAGHALSVYNRTREKLEPPGQCRGADCSLASRCGSRS
jgi:3-hydroxyisobutyrate dehydrogenase-like beta-hydroxyacid dehydrogenase